MKYLFAIPLENGILSQHFGHCQQFAFVEVENGSITKQTLITPPPHEPGLLPAWLAEKGITDIIASGIGQKAINLFQQQHIRVYMGAQHKSPAELVSDWMEESLTTGVNACDH
ncbi:NifB/NifX family molybdenum-iron cluster-binding protein [Porphyromonadaceae sp. NP-X]|jgi:predicted Fe-Mo cluster-binding NifX family protein|nr:NifB/NifX family molybdenum-iron cluster-binding protein [Porphyromonadaceae sp. NP-X]